MSFIEPQQQKKKKPTFLIIGVLGVLLFFGGAVVLRLSQKGLLAPLSINKEEGDFQIKKTDWKKTLFEDPLFLSLKNYMPPPLGDVSGGNPMPFRIMK